jgi:membrane protein required for colicin V production
MHISQLTALDYIFACIIIISTIFALRKGLVREIVSLVALIGGLVLAGLYYKIPAAKLAGFTRTDSIAELLGFLIIFAGCIIVGITIAAVINRFIKAASLKWIDRLLGGIFGFLRGWAISSIMVVALIAFPLKEEEVIARSVLAPFLLAGARGAVILVPQHLKDKFYEQYKKVLQIWNQKNGDGKTV